jgi:hypothetical protein
MVGTQNSESTERKFDLYGPHNAFICQDIFNRCNGLFRTAMSSATTNRLDGVWGSVSKNSN